MKAIPSVASAPATEVIQCHHCFGKVRVPAGIGTAKGPCPFCGQQLATQTWNGQLPPIPTMRPEMAVPLQQDYAASAEVHIQTQQQTISAQSQPTPEAEQVTVDQWSAKRFAPTAEVSSEPATVPMAAPIVQQPRLPVNRERGVVEEGRAQPFERNGVFRLNATINKPVSAAQLNRKFMQSPDVPSEVPQVCSKKKKWGLSLLGAFVLTGLGAGGFFVFKAQQIASEGESVNQGFFVSDHRR
ncbi:hypothetical protein N9Z02_01040 [Akkermansiaceae bacterium]|nr:hypothetical protein [Akkermansiaceae bacterium]